MLFCLVIASNITWAGENKIDGYFWKTLTPKEKNVYVAAYIEGISQLNLEIRHQMDVLIGLHDMEKTEENKYLAAYGKETKGYYEENYNYFDIPYRQLVEGLDKIYADFKNKTIRLNDALFLVKSMLKGVNEETLEKSIIFMRKSEEEQKRIINKDFLEMKNK